MLKPLDITHTTFDALNNAPTAAYEAIYEAIYEAVSEAVFKVVSEANASHFHELSRKLNQPQIKNNLIIEIQNSESEISSA